MRKQIAYTFLIVFLAGCSVSPQNPEKTLVPTLGIVTSTAAPVTPWPSGDPTLVPTSTLEPAPAGTATAVPLPSPIETEVVVKKPYGPQMGSVRYLANFTHPDLNCQWTGLAGQAFGEDGLPRTDLQVEVRGDINGMPVQIAGVTGKADLYGEGGYEIKLGDKPFDSPAVFSAQLFDMAGNPLSDPVDFRTYADCGKALILLNFQVGYQRYQAYLPVIGNGAPDLGSALAKVRDARKKP